MDYDAFPPCELYGAGLFIEAGLLKDRSGDHGGDAEFSSKDVDFFAIAAEAIVLPSCNGRERLDVVFFGLK